MAIDSVCSKCKALKPIEEFSVSVTGRRAGKPFSRCRTCRASDHKERKKRDPSVYDRIEWPSKIKKMYGITPKDYDKMFDSQGGACAVCKSKVPGGGKGRFMIDHCHATKKVRGLLCQACNRAIGLLKDNPENAVRVAAYLNKNRHTET